MVARPRGDAEELAALRSGVERWRAAGHDVEPRLTFESADASRFARAFAASRCDVVVAVGGDGTVNRVVNGMSGETWRPRLAVVPTGTANDFAHGLELPLDVAAAMDVAVSGRVVEVDIARVNDRLFVNVSTGGFGAEATDDAPKETKRLLGPLAYLITGAKKFVELEPTPASFEADGELLYDGRFMLFAVGNARRTGGGSLLTPRARFGDGRLDVLIVPELPRVEFLALLPDLRNGTHVDSPHVIYRQVPSLRVLSERDLSVNADGEPLRGRSFDYGLTGRSLGVMVPLDARSPRSEAAGAPGPDPDVTG